jgi:hypothetical protein
MTDFIIYISVQQRMQTVMNDTEAIRAARQRDVPLVGWSSCRAVRQRVSVALYRLAEAIQPTGEPPRPMMNAPL